MSSQRGDYQRSAVYRWEAEHVHPKDTGTVPFDQAQAIVDYVWARAGLIYPPKIRELARTARRTTANADRRTISIPATGVSATVLLHEIAHSMTTDAASGRSHAHGPRFVGALIKLLCDLIPTFSLDALMVSARQEGIEFNFDGPIHLRAIGSSGTSASGCVATAMSHSPSGRRLSENENAAEIGPEIEILTVNGSFTPF